MHYRLLQVHVQTLYSPYQIADILLLHHDFQELQVTLLYRVFLMVVDIAHYCLIEIEHSGCCIHILCPFLHSS